MRTSALILAGSGPLTTHSSDAVETLKCWDRHPPSMSSGTFINESLALIQACFVTQMMGWPYWPWEHLASVPPGHN